MEWHLFGVSEDEAEASIDEHGEGRCAWAVRGKPCGRSPVLGLIMKPPGAAWGQGLKTTQACRKHAPGLREIIRSGPPEQRRTRR